MIEKKYEVAVKFNGGCETRFSFETENEAIECAMENAHVDADGREWVAIEQEYEDGDALVGVVIRTFKK